MTTKIFTSLFYFFLAVSLFSQNITSSIPAKPQSSISPIITETTIYPGEVKYIGTVNIGSPVDGRNDDTISTVYGSLQFLDSPELNWISFSPDYLINEIMVPPQLDNLNEFPTGYHWTKIYANAEGLKVGKSYRFKVGACSEWLGEGTIGTRTCVETNDQFLDVIPYPIVIINSELIDGGYSNVQIEWEHPEVQNLNIEYYQIYGNPRQNIIIDSLINARALTKNIPRTSTSVQIDNLPRDINYYFVVAAFDNNNKLIGASEEFQCQGSLDNFDLISPNDDSFISSNQITFTWENFGSGIFDLYLSDNQEFTDPRIIRDISDVSLTLDTNLSDNKTYYWKVISNTGESSNQTNWRFHKNINDLLPTNFSLTIPADNSIVNILRPEFGWEESHDYGDIIKYNIQIANDNTMNDIIIDDTTNFNFYYPKTNLEDNKQYFWRVICYDFNGNEIISEIFDFETDYNNFPTDVVLLKPRAETLNFITSLPEFEWNESLDADLNYPITYDLKIAENAEFINLQSYSTTDTTLIPTQALSENTFYYWKVDKTDATGNTNYYKGFPNAFYVNEVDDPPTELTLTFPESNRQLGEVNSFQWERPVDDMYDIYFYDVYYSDDKNNIKQNSVLGNIMDTSISLPQSLGNGKYYWQVVGRSKIYTDRWDNSYIIASEIDSFIVSDDAVFTEISVQGPYLASCLTNITWKTLGISAINIYVSYDGQITWQKIANDTPTSDDLLYTFEYRWDKEPSENIYVKLEDSSNPNIYVISSKIITTMPAVSIILEAPNGGEIFKTGTSTSVKFSFEPTGVGVRDTVIFEFSSDGGETWSESKYTGNFYTYSANLTWNIPNNVSDECLVRIRDFYYRDVFDISDNLFSIIKYPTFYVAKQGDDVNGEGTKENPFASIQHTINISQNNDSIFVSTGIFEETLDLTFKERIIEGGYNFPEWTKVNEKTTLEANNAVALNFERTGLRLNNFKIINASYFIFYPVGSGGGINTTVISNCIIEDVDNLSYYLRYVNSLTFNNCSFLNSLSGFILREEFNVYFNNCLFDMIGNKVFTIHSVGAAKNLVVSNCTFSKCSTVFEFTINPGNLQLYNNIFTNSDLIIDNTSNSNVTCETNLFFNNTNNANNFVINNNNLFQDPFFVDQPTKDFHLNDISPCIGAGTVNTLQYDIEGKPRPNPSGSNPDIGAYENELSQPVDPIFVNAKIWLEGPYINQEMNSSLSTSQSVSKSQPFNKAPWNYNGNESVEQIPESVVDWVLLELRDKDDSSITKARRAAFVLNNGFIVDTDGTSNVKFGIREDQYYLVVKHRNHLSVMSSGPISISDPTSISNLRSNLNEMKIDD